jgi:outer membrane receptor protein involved in Fe transport
MHKFFIFLIGAVLCTATVKAQNRATALYSINGQVVDSLANEPVAFATVSVAFVQAPTQFVNAAACDGNGKFEIRLKVPGNYLMTIQSVGINTLVKPFSLTETNKKIDFGKLVVKEKAQAISEVTVSAQRPLVKVEIDKLIYSMEDDPEAKVNNTLEMLRKVPLITVDGEDKIQLKGMSNFKIYMNGKPSNMLSGQNVSDVLKSMPANTIKNIEVITDPGARYDAEGIGGIINIITTRNQFKGYQGSVSANAGTFGSFGGSTYLTAKTGKLGLTGNLNFTNSRRPWGEMETVSENLINDLYYQEKSDGRSKYIGTFMYGNLEASYEIDTLRLLSLGVNLWNGNQKSISERTIEMFSKAGSMEYSYKTDGDGKYGYGSTGVNLDYQRSTRKKGELITFSYRLNNSPNDNGSYTYAKDITGEMPLYIRLNQWYDNKARTTEHTGQLDYTNPITPKHTIEAGLKYILRQNISNVKQYVLGTGSSWDELPSTLNSDFKHISNIYAGYAGYAFKEKKFGFRTGIRAEGTKQDVEFRLDKNQNFGVDYYNVVPSVTASYQLKPTQQLRLGYNLRIFRPSIWYLNPYVNDTDPYNISYGNPKLDPEKSNSFNLNYSYFSPKYTLNISTNYSYVNNAIERYMFIADEKPEVKQQTYKNIGRNQRAGIYVNAGWTPNQKLRFNFNGGLSYTDLKSSELNAANSGLNGNCYINAQLTLPKDFRINVNGSYMSGWVMLQGSQSGYYFASISANKDFLKKKLTVSLSCSNPFGKYLKFKMTMSNDYFATNYKQYMPIREGRISISYRFGTMKEAIKKVQRGISNDDVKSGGDNSSGGGGGVSM